MTTYFKACIHTHTAQAHVCEIHHAPLCSSSHPGTPGRPWPASTSRRAPASHRSTGTLAAPRGAGHITSHPKSLLIFAANTLAKAAVKRPTIPDACRQQDDGTARHDIAQARTYAPGVVRRTRLAVTDRIGSPLALLPPAPALPATVLTTKTPHRSRPRKAATSIASPDASDGMWLTWAASATTARAAIASHIAAIAAFTGAIHVTVCYRCRSCGSSAHRSPAPLVPPPCYMPRRHHFGLGHRCTHRPPLVLLSSQPPPASLASSQSSTCR